MEVILLEKIRNLGGVTDKVLVKSGYGRNYLIPYGKAVIATKENIEKFNKMKADLEAKANEVLLAAQERAKTFQDLLVNIKVKASPEGKLFGSVGINEIVLAMKELGHEIKRSEVTLPKGSIREVGEYDVTLLLHTDVSANIKVNVETE